jgi:thiol-disulfide isomerase/thioredoxin
MKLKQERCTRGAGSARLKGRNLTKEKLLALLLTAVLLISACEPSDTPESPKNPESTEEQGSDETRAVREVSAEPAPFLYAFTAPDIYGNTITEADLGEKEVFFVYHWATWCSACVNGMADLAEAAQRYQDRVGFIGLLDDYDSNLEGAVNIVESAGIPESFFMVDANEPSISHLLSMTSTGYLPSTLLIFHGEPLQPHIGSNKDLLDEFFAGYYA